MSCALITFSQAKLHLNELGNDRDDDIEEKLSEASDIVMDYLKLSDVPDEWLASTSPLEYRIPAKVQAATKLVLGEIFENRESTTSDPISDAVVRLLHRLRDPALA